jgi:hypothetical protein
MMERFGFRVVPVHPGHTGLHSDSDFMKTINTGDKSSVYGYDPVTNSFRHFPYNDNPTRALNTTSLKYCLLLDAINRQEKIHPCV